MSFCRGRSSSRSSAKQNFPSNGRKRRLTSSEQASTSQNSSSSKNNKRKQTSLDFAPTTKRSRTSSSQHHDSSNCPGTSGLSQYFPTIEPQPSSDSEEEEEERPVFLNGNMAQLGSTFSNKTIGSNSFRIHKAAGGTGANNHAKKGGGGKKLVIKNRKTKSELPENYSELAWDKLRQSVSAIHTQQPISYSLEELYQAVENICSHKMATKLYENLRGECEKHVQSLATGFQQPALDQAQFLLVVDKQWTSHCRQMIMIRSIFLYLNRTYAVPSTSLLSIWDLGLELFSSLVASQSGVQDRLVKGILTLVHRERSHESVDRGLLKSLLQMFVDLQIYQDVFRA